MATTKGIPIPPFLMIAPRGAATKKSTTQVIAKAILSLRVRRYTLMSFC